MCYTPLLPPETNQISDAAEVSFQRIWEEVSNCTGTPINTTVYILKALGSSSNSNNTTITMAGSIHEARQINDHDAFHARNLEDTLQELQSIVKEHEDALDKVRAIALVTGITPCISKLTRSSYVPLPLRATRAGVCLQRHRLIS